MKQAIDRAKQQLELHRNDAEWLAHWYPLLDEIEKWCADTRAALETMVKEGQPVPGYKLVQGKEGSRRWRDADAAKTLLAKSGIPSELYLTKPDILTAPALEKVIKRAYPEVWVEAERLIHRPEGKPTVVPNSDPRPALGSVADEFESLL